MTGIDSVAEKEELYANINERERENIRKKDDEDEMHRIRI